MDGRHDSGMVTQGAGMVILEQPIISFANEWERSTQRLVHAGPWTNSSGSTGRSKRRSTTAGICMYIYSPFLWSAFDAIVISIIGHLRSLGWGEELDRMAHHVLDLRDSERGESLSKGHYRSGYGPQVFFGALFLRVPNY